MTRLCFFRVVCIQHDLVRAILCVRNPLFRKDEIISGKNICLISTLTTSYCLLILANAFVHALNYNYQT